MSGHSHWSTIKRKKGALDQKRGQTISKLMSAVHVALREGNNPLTNLKLRDAIERAKTGGVSQEAIERALNKSEQVIIDEVRYEAYGPGGVALIILAQTDSKNRTTNELKHLLTQTGGKLAEPGAVLWMFQEAGLIRLDCQSWLKAGEPEVLLDVLMERGLNDYQEDENELVLLTDPKLLFEIKKILEEKNIKILNCELQYLPQTTTAISQADQAQLDRCLSKLLDHADVINVYSNLG